MFDIWLAFIPVFVAVDAIGLLPIFVGLTQGLNPQEKRKIIYQSILTALSLACGFVFLGRIIFKLLGITMGDFMIAGGTILFCIAVIDLLIPVKQSPIPADEIGAVPIGTPLIAGPAVLTTSLMLVDYYGWAATIISVFLNILFVGFIFIFSDHLIKIIGQSGSRALSKVMALLLAAIAVMMIRKGVMQIIAM